ncbi:MAG: hypothetical protein J0M35_07285 [Candidatus Obscuribacter phosphatis]|uniref:Uncharacterized protein n=1 Tax=Candidatus Obscuribacter phosphatis TaxID=1906157 RepID=A0A8J7PI39_9BACT|nr:hypothetical protein [Candidatus Obscuribacter phosphatis]
MAMANSMTLEASTAARDLPYNNRPEGGAEDNFDPLASSRDAAYGAAGGGIAADAIGPSKSAEKSTDGFEIVDSQKNVGVYNDLIKEGMPLSNENGQQEKFIDEMIGGMMLDGIRKEGFLLDVDKPTDRQVGEALIDIGLKNRIGQLGDAAVKSELNLPADAGAEAVKDAYIKHALKEMGSQFGQELENPEQMAKAVRDWAAGTMKDAIGLKK